MAKLTEEQQAELDAIAGMSDDEIDFSDISEGPLNPSNLRRGAFYIPVKKKTTLTLDEYALNWFTDQEENIEARDEAINKVLLDYIRRCQISKARKTNRI